jgi:acyl-coenzyme A thioesterase PaaI-like protein
MEFPAQIPFAALLGFELLGFADGEAEVACDVRDDLCN